MCGAFGTFAHQAYTACLRGQLSSNVRLLKNLDSTVMTRTFLLLALGLSLTVPALAAWTTKTTKDSMTDALKREAVVVNEDGHSLSIYRVPSGEVWANFALSNRSGDQLSPRQAPIYRVDKNEPDDLDLSRRLTERKLGVVLYAWEPKWINFSLWHGKEEQGRGKKMMSLMSGESVVFRYYLGAGGYKETSFTLIGAGEAIAEALGIPLSPDPEAEAKARAFNAAFSAASKACTTGPIPNLRACIEKVTSCQKQSGRDTTAFTACIQ